MAHHTLLRRARHYKYSDAITFIYQQLRLRQALWDTEDAMNRIPYNELKKLVRANAKQEDLQILDQLDEQDPETGRRGYASHATKLVTSYSEQHVLDLMKEIQEVIPIDPELNPIRTQGVEPGIRLLNNIDIVYNKSMSAYSEQITQEAERKKLQEQLAVISLGLEDSQQIYNNRRVQKETPRFYADKTTTKPPPPPVSTTKPPPPPVPTTKPQPPPPTSTTMPPPLSSTKPPSPPVSTTKPPPPPVSTTKPPPPPVSTTKPPPPTSTTMPPPLPSTKPPSPPVSTARPASPPVSTTRPPSPPTSTTKPPPTSTTRPPPLSSTKSPSPSASTTMSWSSTTTPTPAASPTTLTPTMSTSKPSSTSTSKNTKPSLSKSELESQEREEEFGANRVLLRPSRQSSPPPAKQAGGTNSVGSPAHIEFMKKTYDHEEDVRRNLTHSGVNSKLQFVTQKLQEDIRRNFERSFEEACNIRNRQVLIWWAILRLNPTIGIRTILNRNDVAAVFAGPEVVAVTQCRTVEVKEIMFNHKINDTCYVHTPIKSTKDEVFYLVPGTTDLVRSSAAVDCASVTPSVFRLNGTYRAGSSNADVTTLPGTGSMLTTQLQKLNFNSSDLFETAKGSSFPLLLAISYGANLVALQQQHNNILEILTGSQFLREKTSMMQTEATELFEESSKAVDSVLSSTRDWIVNNLLRIGLIPVIVGISVLALVIVFKCFLYRRVFNMIFRSSITEAVHAVIDEEVELAEPSAPEFEEETSLRKTQKKRKTPSNDSAERRFVRTGRHTRRLMKKREREEEVDDMEEEAEIDSDERERYYWNGRRNLPLFAFVPILLPAVCAATSEGRTGVLPYIPISLEDRGITALWDSGASISYARESTIHYLGINKFENNDTSATTANGSKIRFLGKITLGVRICNTYMEHSFLVSENTSCPAPVLLGTDFMMHLEQNGTPATLHLSKGILSVDNKNVKLCQPGETVYRQTKKVNQLMCTEEIHLKPGESRYIKATLKNAEVDAHRQWMLLPKEKKDIVFGKTIFHPQICEEVTLPVTNTGHKGIRLLEGNAIGRAFSIAPIGTTAGAGGLYVPPEADWEARLPELSTKSDFMKELNADECKFSSTGKVDLQRMIQLNKEAFYNGDGNIGCFKGNLVHKIELRTDMPFPKSRTYRIPLGKQEEVERQVKALLDQGIIEPSVSLFTSPIVLVKKRDDTFRFTTDFRQLNAVTRKQTYVIPHISDIVDLAAGAQFFSNLDLISGFFQIPLREKDRQLTAFTTTTGTYQYRRMPMGLCSSPNTFQSAVRILQNKVQCCLFTYLDDLLIVSETESQHLRDIDEVLKAIIELGMKIRLKKCAFGVSEVHFLGLVIGRDGVKPNPKKIQAIVDFPIPKSPTAVRSFIGLTNYFRRFVKDFAAIAHPLYELTTRSPETFGWEAQHQEAFDALKKALCTAPVLASLTANRPFTIESDGSTIAIGAVLLQSATEGEEPHPIAYASRKLVKAERNYPPIEIEALALVFAVTEFRTYILGTKTLAITDHRPLTSLLKRKDLIGRLSKYQIVLQEYDIEITYRPGKANDVGDALSRYCQDEQNPPRPVTKHNVKPPAEAARQQRETTVNYVDVKRDELVDAQQKCAWIRQAVEAIQSRPNDAPKFTDKYEVIEGLLYAKRKDLFAAPAVILPRDAEIINKLVKQFHESAQHSFHFGISKTLNNLQRRFQWTNMKEDVRNVVTKCIDCKRRKINVHEETQEPLGRMEAPSFPFQRVHMDVLGPLPITISGNRYILTMIDAFSKMLVTSPMVTQDAITISRAFVEKLYTIHGCPDTVVTDNGTSFLSEVFKKTLAMCGAKQSLTPPYHKNPNGQVERSHRTLEELLSTYVNSNQTDWDAFLPQVTMAINCAENESNGISPFQAVYGREPRLPNDAEWKTPLRTFLDCEDYCSVLHFQLQETWTTIRNRLEETTLKMQRQHAKQRRTANRIIELGDEVLLKRALPRNKLAARLHGPFTVTGIHGSTVTVRDERGKSIQAHKDHVRVFQRSLEAEESPDEESGTEKDTPQQTTLQEQSPDPSPCATPIPPPRRSARLAQKKVTFVNSSL